MGRWFIREDVINFCLAISTLTPSGGQHWLNNYSRIPICKISIAGKKLFFTNFSLAGKIQIENRLWTTIVSSNDNWFVELIIDETFSKRFESIKCSKNKTYFAVDSYWIYCCCIWLHIIMIRFLCINCQWIIQSDMMDWFHDSLREYVESGLHGIIDWLTDICKIIEHFPINLIEWMNYNCTKLIIGWSTFNELIMVERKINNN